MGYTPPFCRVPEQRHMKSAVNPRGRNGDVVCAYHQKHVNSSNTRMGDPLVYDAFIICQPSSSNQFGMLL